MSLGNRVHRSPAPHPLRRFDGRSSSRHTIVPISCTANNERCEARLRIIGRVNAVRLANTGVFAVPELQEDQIVGLALVMAGRFHRIVKGDLHDNGALPAPHRHRSAWLDRGVLLSHLTFALGNVDADVLWLDIMTRAVRLVVPDAPSDQISNLLTHARESRGKCSTD